MTISRGQMNRQLREGGGIMSLSKEGIGGGDYRGIDMGSRTGFGILKKISRGVKKVAKGVKKIASSDLGKAALIAAAGAYAGGLGPFAKGSSMFGGKLAGIRGAGFAQGLFPSIMDYSTPTRSFFTELGKKFTGSGITKALTGNVGKVLGLGALTGFLTSQYGMTEQQAEQALADPESRKSYLRMYYTNLNPNAGSEEIEEFVAANVTEYAEGGRIGFAEGPVLPPDTTQPVNPFGPKPEDFGIDEDIPIKMASNIENDKILEALFEKYLDMGLSPKEAAEKAREEFERMGKKRMEPTIRGVAALGGRMGFDEGTPQDPDMAEDLANMAMRDEKVTVVIGPDGKLMMVTEDQLKEMLEKNMSPDQKGILNIDREQVLEGIVPRSNKALGDSASTNAMQAASVEGLPIRQNPKGVKELDLRKTGGFIPPVGIKEKADDIPAMLSNNEFVFTADAVRGAGGGDVNVGAQRMYDTMKRLEAGGKA